MNRWQGWAQRLRARHGHTTPGRQPGAMVLLRAVGASTSALNRHQYTHLHLHPQFSAQFFTRQLATVPRAAVANGQGSGGAGPAAPSAGRPMQAPAQPDGRTTLALQAVAEAAPVTAPVLLAPRGSMVKGRSMAMRRDSIGTPLAAMAPPGATLRASAAIRSRRQAVREESRAPAPGVVLVKRPAAAAQPEVAAANAQLRVQLEQARTMAAQSAPAINVEALTCMVIEQIDRRMLAYRERMGRG